MLIFVYGTLRKGQVNQHFMDEHAKFVSHGFVKGQLYQIKNHHYPAVLEGDEWVVGEVYEFDPKGLAELDHLEGYISEDNENNLYNRIELEAFDENKESLGLAHTYVMNTTHPLYDETDLEPIESQDFLKR